MGSTLAKKTRTEADSLGTVEVPAGAYWGAQTERAIRNFRIGTERMPPAIVHALGLIKKASARANARLGVLEPAFAKAIEQAADEVIAGKHDGHFPLLVWQSGSGTQTNMNVNEVIANLANVRLGRPLGAKAPVHPNDHVNRGQSSNDSIPTAMHLAAALELRRALRPALDHLAATLEGRARAFRRVIKIGRTHLQDAAPLTLGQELSGCAAQVRLGIARLDAVMPRLCRLAQGGTAVGTGLNTVRGFDRAVVAELARQTGLKLKPAGNKFEAVASSDAIVELSGALNVIAVSLMKIANDVRLLASGPRAGLGELIIPANEPGSSIMPGKVNPTQAEALAMVCARVMGNHVTITVAGASGQLELNVFRPVMIDACLQSIRLLADSVRSFADHCVRGLEANRVRVDELMRRSLMLGTALVPVIGYDAAAKAVLKAHRDGTTLKDAVLALDLLSAATFDRLADPARMLGPANRPTRAGRSRSR